ncbi:hypothetical protein TNCV_3185021 [Trichonephila clavipes]|nr:hypothetical protein TNCV_3185021 [Trichonephila clavipes]
MLRRLVGNHSSWTSSMIVQLRNEKVSNHVCIPITIDCNVVAFIVFEEGFHQPIKRTKQTQRCLRITYECRAANAVVESHNAKKKRKKEHKHTNETENILLKGCSATGVRNYHHKSSGRPYSGAAWNSVCSGKIFPIALR